MLSGSRYKNSQHSRIFTSRLLYFFTESHIISISMYKFVSIIIFSCIPLLKQSFIYYFCFRSFQFFFAALVALSAAKPAPKPKPSLLTPLTYTAYPAVSTLHEVPSYQYPAVSTIQQVASLPTFAEETVVRNTYPVNAFNVAVPAVSTFSKVVPAVSTINHAVPALSTYAAVPAVSTINHGVSTFNHAVPALSAFSHGLPAVSAYSAPLVKTVGYTSGFPLSYSGVHHF